MSKRKFRPEEVVEILRHCASPALQCDGCQAISDKGCCAAPNFNGLADIIEELLEQVRWIPVGERLPELIPCNAGPGHGYSEAVQICTDGKKVLTAVYSHEGWIFDEGFWEAWDESVTHWRPVVGNLPWAREGV